jgi:hypothetical protein
MLKRATWEVVCNESGQPETRRTARLRVPGGHIYRCEVQTPSGEDFTQLAVAMVFVPKRKSKHSRHARRQQ